MLGLILDAAAIIGIIYLVNQGQEMDFGPAILSALIISVASFICVLTLAPTIGIFALVPMLAVAIVVIWMVSGIPLGRAAIAGVLFFVYRVILTLAFKAMLG